MTLAAEHSGYPTWFSGERSAGMAIMLTSRSLNTTGST